MELTPKKKILIVDDEPDIAHMVGICLKSKGFEVATANDGDKGLEKLKTFRPDLILLDILMPRMDGWEFCRHLHADADPAIRETPIVIMTAFLPVDKAGHSERDGNYPILVKPFKEEDLLEMIRASMGGKEILEMTK